MEEISWATVFTKKESALYHYLKYATAGGEATPGFLGNVRDKLAELDAEAFRDELTTLAEETIIDVNDKPYKTSDTFEALNDIGLIRDGLIVIGGEASAGKTSFLTALGLDILTHNQNAGLLVYTLDDSKQLTARRILTQASKENLFTGKVDEWQNTHRDLLGRIVLRDHIDLASLDLEARAAQALIDCERLLIMIDYLQILPLPDGDARQGHNMNLKRLKSQQARLDCPIFLASQLNRDDKAKWRFRETSEIENQADVALVIDTPEDDDSNERTIRILKNKLGARGQKFNTAIDEHLNWRPLQRISTDTNTEPSAFSKF